MRFPAIFFLGRDFLSGPPSYDSYEGKGGSEGCSAAYEGLYHKASIDRSRKFNSSKVPFARKQNLLVDSSKDSFSYDEMTKNEENEYLASRSGKQQKTYFTSSDEDDKSESNEGSIPICD